MSDKFTSWEEAVQWLKAQPNQQDLVRSCYFDDPLEFAADRYVQSEEWNEIKQFLYRWIPGVVLDIGAGLGITSYAFACNGCEVIALEPDPSDIVGAKAIHKLASETKKDIRVVRAEAEALPFPADTFDIVHGRQVLHHARHLERFCFEVAKALKPGGLFIATREHVISKRDDLSRFLDTHPLHHIYGGENAYLLSQYTDAIQKAGIHLKSIITPWQSNINLYPLRIQDIKRKIAGKAWFPFPRLIPSLLVHWLGSRINTPGRLYTFIGIK